MGEIASPGQLRMSLVRWALVTVPLILFLGIASGRLAGSGYGNRWFDALEKPGYMPPGWVFGVAWTINYLLLGIALALVLAARGARLRPAAIAVFAVGFVLNLVWSPLFFAAHRILPALLLIVAMFLVTLFAALLFYRIRPPAGLLLVPYLAWLVFAAALNFEIWQRNPNGDVLAPEPAGTQITL